MVAIFAVVHVIVIFAVGFQVRTNQPALKHVFWPAFVVKLMSGVCLGLVYTYYYSVSDTFIYFRDASTLAALAHDNFPAYIRFLLSGTDAASVAVTLTEPRALFLTKITSIASLFAQGNYWIIGLYFSMISFLASWFLVQKISRHFPDVTNAAILSFLFLPSAVFWSSGLLKESLAMAALTSLCTMMLGVWFAERITVPKIMMTILALWILWNLKYFYAGIFIPVALTTMLYKKIIHDRSGLSAGREALTWLALFIVLLAVASLLHPNFHIDRIFAVIVANNSAYVQLSDPGEFVRFHNLAATFPAILLNAPWALFSGLFRPFVWEATSWIQVLQGIENTFLLLLFTGALVRVRSYRTSPHRPLLLGVIVYAVLLSVLITLSAPNFGTLSRFRTGYLPFFVFLILCNNPFLEYVERSFNRLVRK